VEIRLARGQEVVAGVLTALERRRVSIQQVQWQAQGDSQEECVLRMRVRPEPAFSRSDLTALLSDQQGVKAVEWD
jgi:uncharacterized membrane protein YhiD involved in acid resistance